MRGLWGVIGLLVTLAVVGVVMRQQLQAVSTPVPALQLPNATAPLGTGDAAGQPDAAPQASPTTPAQQSQQLQQQVKRAVEGAMQPRPIDDTP